MKNFIEKINSWIQWTKQWHFFHVFFVGSFLLCNWFPYAIMFLYLIGYIYILFTGDISALTDEDDYSWKLLAVPALLVFLFSHFIIVILGILTELIIFIKRRKHQQTMSVKSSFLLNNKIYNFLYINFVIASVYGIAVLIYLLL